MNVTIHIAQVSVSVSSTAKLESIMTTLTASLETLNATLEATSATLTRVTTEQASLLDAVADLTDKLAAALAAGQAVPPGVVAAIEKANATAAAIKAKAEGVDALVPDAP